MFLSHHLLKRPLPSDALSDDRLGLFQQAKEEFIIACHPQMFQKGASEVLLLFVFIGLAMAGKSLFFLGLQV